MPVDGSQGAVRAAEFAAQLARKFGGSVILLHVYDAPTASTLGLLGLPAVDLEDIRTRLAQDSFRQAIDAMGDLEPEASLVELGDPAEQIVVAATAQRADHIVMGTRGLSPVKGLLLGSVSDRVAREAPCPVTLVR